MRTTVEFPDSLFVRAKSRAMQQHRPLKELFIEALEENLSSTSLATKQRIQLPLVPCSKPGSNDLTAEKIDAIESALECRATS